MNQQIKETALWILGLIFTVAFIYLAFFIISVIRAAIFSPIIIYQTIKENAWSEVSPYYKLIIIFGSLIFVVIVIGSLWPFVKWIKEKIK